METSVAIASIMGPALLVMGLSVLMYNSSWQKVVKSFEKDHLGFLSIGFVEMVFGLVLIHFHNDWTGGWPVIISVIAWAMFIEGAFYMLAPGSWTKCILKSCNSKTFLALAGLIGLVLGAMLSYQAFMV